MKLKKHDQLSVKIEKLAFGGKGIAYVQNEDKDNFVIFVDNVVPGDEVNIKLNKVKSNFAEGSLVEITKLSPIRIQARCPHFDTCGGCTLQTIPYEEQLKIKESQVRESIEHIGNIKEMDFKPIIGCDSEWFYRNKMEFSFGYEDDGKPLSEKKIAVGLHPKYRRYDVFELKECYLESEDTGNFVKAVQKFMRDLQVAPYHSRTNSGVLRSITVREGKRSGERLVNILTSGEDFEPKNEFINLLTKESDKNGFKAATSIYITKQVIKKGQRTRFEEELIYGEPYLLELMKLENSTELKFEILPQAFFQTNTLQAEILYAKVLELGEIKSTSTVFDLFCGTGTIGLFCAHKAKKIFGVDINQSAIENANSNAKTNDIQNATFVAGDAFKVIAELEEKPDIIIVDPPRSGLNEDLINHILKIKAKRLIYVSCNPTTLARDLKFLCEKYKLQTVQPIDMFPHTYHVETVCELILQNN
ncbi:23S rRNA (uracil(1939)-C(5))-methyltransferase RlmD [Patescibacteria group bacterium]|nr:23S rRNA (uracil(1939)-C(5))-methyltransferase RlmD [Patescibacteria group bacterium]